MRMSVKSKDRRNGLKMVKQCFLGSEAVDFLIMKGHARSRKESEDIGNELINLGMIMHASGAEAFRDSRACYVFVDSPLYGPMRQPPEQQSRNIAMKEGGFIFASAVLKLGGAFKNKLQQRYMEIERIDSRIEIKYYNNIRKLIDTTQLTGPERCYSGDWRLQGGGELQAEEVLPGNDGPNVLLPDAHEAAQGAVVQHPLRVHQHSNGGVEGGKVG
eukprot:jgi/Bigna1/77844/fgenesh1_pg.50_\